VFCRRGRRQHRRFQRCVRAGDTWFLAALFVDPIHQGKGVGRCLLDLSLRDAPPRRITITEAIQPASNVLYARRGLIPTAPVLHFQGTPSVDKQARLESDLPDLASWKP